MARLAALLLWVLVACSAWGGTSAGGGGGKGRTLVVLEELSVRSTHSLFFRDLEERGHALHFIKAEDLTDSSLTFYGAHAYDTLVVFSGGLASGGQREEAQMLPEAAGAILEFVDSGRSLFLALSPDASDVAREIALECGVAADEDKGFVQDHFGYDAADDGSHTLMSSSEFIDAEIVVGKVKHNPILFRGTGLAAVEGNPLVLPVLRAPSTAYTYGLNKPIKDAPLALGSKTLLVAATQARNNARVIVAGSVEMFGDKAYTSDVSKGGGGASPAGNQAFTAELLNWAFDGRGLLRVDKVFHKVLGGQELPTAYRVQEDLHFEAKISELVDGNWVPYDYDKVQVEFVMLDPWVRVTLSPDGEGSFSAAFKVPDVYGVYQFKLVHKRCGYGNIESSTQVSVRPYRHNEYERFIAAAYPYYTSAFSMMLSSFVFGVVFLYHSQPSGKAKTD